MSILETGLQKATMTMICRSDKLAKLELSHIIKQKLGNNPVDTFGDNNIYAQCKISKIDPLIIAGFGDKSERGLGASRDIDYSSYVTKMCVAAIGIPLVKTNGPFQNITSELDSYLYIWKKYYGSRTRHNRITLNDKPINPFSVISSGITLNNRYLHFEMMVANIRLVNTNPGEMKYFGDLILFASENIGLGSTYTSLNNYTENDEERTTLSCLSGSEYGHKLLEEVEASFANLDFIRTELEKVAPKLSFIKHLLWVSNTFKSK